MNKLYLTLITVLFVCTIKGQTLDYSRASNFYDIVKEYNLSPPALLPDSVKGAVNKEYERNFLKPIKSWNLGSDQQGIKVFDTRKLTNGVYFYELLQDGSKLKGGKFIVQH